MALDDSYRTLKILFDVEWVSHYQKMDMVEREDFLDLFDFSMVCFQEWAS